MGQEAMRKDWNVVKLGYEKNEEIVYTSTGVSINPTPLPTTHKLAIHLR